jgi:3-hydroxyisobutyrate dehydrogenase-like beta-hydroxyacid dehydrogenase
MGDAAQPRVGVIGLGAMGARIATRLVWQGFNPQVYDVVDVAVRMFTNDVGGMMSGSPKMLGQTSDIVITVLPSADALRDVLYGWQGLASGLSSGASIIDMGAAEPTATVELAERLAERGIDLIDAPALGTPADARAGKLTFVIGGEAAAIERCQPIFAALGEKTYRAGPAGAGQAGAALGDFLRAVQILATGEALRVGQRFGLDTNAVIEIGERLGGIGPTLSAMLREHVLTRRFDTGLALGHVLKGVETTANSAASADVHAPLATACCEAWRAAEGAIGSGADQTEMIRWLELVTVPKPEDPSPRLGVAPVAPL